MIDDKLLQLCFPHLFFSYESPMVCESVQKVNRKGKAQKRLLLITDYCFYVFRPRLFSRAYDVCKSKLLINVNHIYINDDGDGVFEFEDENVVIRCQCISEIVLSLKNYYHSAFNNVSKVFGNDAAILDRNPALRFKYFAKYEEKCNNGEIINMIEQFINSKTDFLKLSDFSENTSLMFHAISCMNSIKKIEIDTSLSNDLVNRIADIFKSNESIEEIIISTTLNTDIGIIAKQISMNSLSRVEKITIMNSSPSPYLAQGVFMFLDLCHIKYIFIDDAFHGILSIALADLIINARNINLLKELIIKSSDSLDAARILPYFKGIKKFSIIDSDLEIAPVFQALINSKNMQIEEIDLSGNFGNHYSNLNGRFPDTLNRIIVKRVTWSPSVMVELFQHFDHYYRNKDVLIDMSSLSLDSGTRWEILFQELSSVINCNISTLIWDNNRVSDLFVKFLNNIESLTSLYMRDMLREFNLFLPQIVDLIKTTKSILTLDISTYSVEGMKPNDTIVILRAFSKNHGIRTLTIKGHPFDNETLDEMPKALEGNIALTKIVFDYSVSISYDSLNMFFEELCQRNIQLDIPWPETLIKDMNISDNNWLNLRSFWEKTISPRKKKKTKMSHTNRVSLKK